MVRNSVALLTSCELDSMVYLSLVLVMSGGCMVPGRHWAYHMFCSTFPGHIICCLLRGITCGTSNCMSYSILPNLPKLSYHCIRVMCVVGVLQGGLRGLATVGLYMTA